MTTMDIRREIHKETKLGFRCKECGGFTTNYTIDCKLCINRACHRYQDGLMTEAEYRQILGRNRDWLPYFEERNERTYPGAD
jgi:hypothetical protein